MRGLRRGRTVGAGSGGRRPIAAGAGRRATAAVEMAIILPFLALLICGNCEIGQAMRVEAILSRAARSGCATGSRPACGNADVVRDVESTLAAGGLPAHAASIRILVNDRAADVLSARRNDKISVTVSIPWSQVQLTRMSFIMAGDTTQSATTTMLKPG